MIVKCRECSKDVSSEASSCPSCGVTSPAPERKEINGITTGTMLLVLVITVFCIASSPQGRAFVLAALWK